MWLDLYRGTRFDARQRRGSFNRSESLWKPPRFRRCGTSRNRFTAEDQKLGSALLLDDPRPGLTLSGIANFDPQ